MPDILGQNGAGAGPLNPLLEPLSGASVQSSLQVDFLSPTFPAEQFAAAAAAELDTGFDPADALCCSAPRPCRPNQSVNLYQPERAAIEHCLNRFRAGNGGLCGNRLSAASAAIVRAHQTRTLWNCESANI